MGQNVTASFNIQTQTYQIPATGPFAGQRLSIPETLGIALANGITVDSINLISPNNLTFVASTPQTLNLHTGSMLDALGNACVYARVRLIIFQVFSQTDGATLTIGNAMTDPWTGFLGSTSVLTMQAASPSNPNGGFLVISAPNTTGMAVSSGSCEILLTPSANAFSANVYIFGSDT